MVNIMAKRLIDWQLVGSELVMGKYQGSEVPALELKRFDIEKIYPDFSKMTEVQKHLVIYGLKQKLADCGSSEKVAEEKVKLAEAKFNDLVEGRLTSVQANGTGAKAAKTLVSNMRKAAEVVSLEGLMTRKILSQNDPSIEWTDEDQVKLDEFMQMKMDHAKVQNGKKK